MRATVQFSEVDAFLAELARDVEMVHRRIVRVSFLTGPVRETPGIVRIRLSAAYEAHETVVRLDLVCGDWWGPEFKRPGEEDARDRAERVRSEVETSVRDLGLDVRPGLLVAPVGTS